MIPGQCAAVFEEQALYVAVKSPAQLSDAALASFSPEQIFWAWCSIALKHQELLVTGSRLPDR